MSNATKAADDLHSITHLRRGLIALGYLVIPLRGKRGAMDNWSNAKWCAEQMEGIARNFPDATNTGILTGEVVALDVDTPDIQTATAINAMVAELPGAKGAPYRIGKAPKCCYLFRTNSPRSKATTGAYLINGHKCQVEVMGSGQQIAAFGTHPETRRPYEWHNGSPAETPVTDLPEIAHADIDALLARADAYFAERGERVKKASKPRANDNERAVVDSDHPWSRLNQRAYDNLDAWVPQLGLEDLKRYQSGFHSVASFRPSNSTTAKKRGRSLNVQSRGVVDYSDGNRGYSPIYLVSVCLGLSPHEAADWLLERVGGTVTPAICVSGLLAQPARRAAARQQTPTPS